MKTIPRHPPQVWRIAGWLFIAGLIGGLRCWIAVHLPAYIWTRDSGSYVAPAIDWLAGHQWVTSPRRGPVYSWFIALICARGGSFAAVAAAQHIVGGLTAVLTIGWARSWLGREAFWPVFFCSFWYALFGLPLELECLIRNETLLVLFSTVAFGAWYFILRTGSFGWCALGGLANGMLQLLKGIFPILPVLVLAGVAWQWRRQPARAAVLAGCYLSLFLLPLAAAKWYTWASHTSRPAEPEDGEMFYGRTAQWAVLDGGVAPDLKPRLRPQVEAYVRRYRATGHLDNNEIVKRTLVPTLKDILVNEQHLQPAEVNRVCWKLGLEAVAHHPLAFLKQVVHDWYLLDFITAQRMILFKPEDLLPSVKDATQFATAHHAPGDPLAGRLFDLAETRRAIAAGILPHGGLQVLARLLNRLAAWRLLSPVFITTLLLPVLVYYTREADRVFWLGLAVLWYFYLMLLSTVGRPLDRYLLPVAPITFWAYCTGLTMLWKLAWQRGWLQARVVET